MARIDYTKGLTKRKNGPWMKTKTIKGKTYSFYSTDPKEVWEKYYQFKEAHTQGPTFASLADEWYSINEGNWRSGTIKAYKPALKRAKEYFANTLLKSIEPADIKNFLLYLKDQGFAEKTVKNQLTVVNQIFTHAITCEAHWRNDNPAEYVSIPSGLTKKRRNPPTEEQITAIRAGLDNEGGLLAAVFLFSGARLGEALALQGKHLQKKKIVVEQEIVYTGNQPQVMPYAKTEAGERDIGALDALLRRLPSIKPDEFLFGGQRPLTYNVYRRIWTNWCKSVGLAHQVIRFDIHGKRISEWQPDVTPHQLRHEYASLCFEAGVDEKVAATMFGHSDPTTMRSIYQAIRARQIEKATHKLNELEQEKAAEKTTKENP